MFIVFFSLLLSLFSSQNNNTKSQNDPNAKLILDAVTKTYKSYPSIQVNFSIITEYPQGKTSTQNGQVFIKNDKYKLLLGNQEIYCDKNAIWVYLKDLNEVQINDYEANQSEITPANMFSIYHSDFFYMQNTNETLAGISYKTIDLMPKDKTKPYFKIRLWIDGKNNIKQLKMFDKNGTRYIYKVNSLNTSQKLEDTFFVFDPKKYPGVHIEDLRM